MIVTGRSTLSWMKRVGLCWFFLAGLLGPFGSPLRGGGVPAWGDFYSFQDEHGVVHFTNTPTDSRFRFFMKEEKRKALEPLYEKTEKGYDGLIQKIAEEKGLDPSLVRAVVQVESNYDHQAVSPKGAMGLMQIMPETAKRLGLSDAFHPEKNLTAGVAYLKGLIEKYGGELPLALAAYNAGAGAVDRYQGIPPYPETRGYVHKVLEAYGKKNTER
jgi:hypothetical protein